ncbi:MAG: tetratricopeptide repeat protein [Promethearchaeota archaeon]
MHDNVQELFSKGITALEKASNASSSFEKREYLQDAVWYFKQALNINPDQLIVQRKLAHTYEELTSYHEAIAIYESILNANPTDEMALYKIETISNKLGQTAKSAEILERKTRMSIDDILKLYKDIEGVDVSEDSMIHWGGGDKSDIADDEEVLLSLEKIEFTAQELKARDAYLILTNKRLILSGERVFGTFTAYDAARTYERRRGKIRHMLTGAPMTQGPPPESLGLTISLKDVRETRIIRFGKFPTLHILYEGFTMMVGDELNHIGLSNFGADEVEKLFEFIKIHATNLSEISDEPFKMCSLVFLLFGGLIVFLLGQILLLGVV